MPSPPAKGPLSSGGGGAEGMVVFFWVLFAAVAVFPAPVFPAEAVSFPTGFAGAVVPPLWEAAVAGRPADAEAAEVDAEAAAAPVSVPPAAMLSR